MMTILAWIVAPFYSLFTALLTIECCWTGNVSLDGKRWSTRSTVFAIGLVAAPAVLAAGVILQ